MRGVAARRPARPPLRPRRRDPAEELVLAAHEGLADARLATGRHAEAVGPLNDLVAQHPLRERFHAQRVLALYRCGRQAEALRAYQAARTVLLEELGLEPGAGAPGPRAGGARPRPRARPAGCRGRPDAPQPSLLPGDREPRRRGGPAAPARAVSAGPAPARRSRRGAAHHRVARRRRTHRPRSDGPGRGRAGHRQDPARRGARRPSREHGATVVWGRSYDGLGAPAFWPWIQVVEAPARRAGPTRRSLAALDGVGVGAGPDRPRGQGAHRPAATRHRRRTPSQPASAVFNAITRFLARMSTHQFRRRSCSTTCSGPTRRRSTSCRSSPAQLDRTRIVVLATYRSIDPTISDTLNGALVQLSRHSLGAPGRACAGLDTPASTEYLTDAGMESHRRRHHHRCSADTGQPVLRR